MSLWNGEYGGVTRVPGGRENVMVSQVVKTDPHWPSLEESMGQDRINSDVVPISSVPGSQAPQPMDGLQSIAPPPFLTKTYDMVDDSATDPVVSWSSGNNSFIVWNPPDFAQELLPKYFKHNNFSSFVRQLNTYGFRKVDPDRWEFANEGFLRGRRDLLRSIHRRKPATHSQQSAQPQHQHQHQHQLSEQGSIGPCVEVGKFGLDEEIEMLKRDKNVLMVELVRLRQQQQNTEREMQAMGQRLLKTESRQQHMMSFLAKAMQNPSFLAQLMQQSENKRLAASVRKKRRLPKQDSMNADDSMSSDTSANNQIVAFQSNGAAESNGARSLIMQFFNSAEDASSPGLDSGPLEALFRDLGSAPSGPDVGTLNRQSGVTLTEMNMPGLDDGLPGPILMDASPEQGDLPMPPHLAARIPRLEGALNMENGSKYSSGEVKPEDLSGEAMEFHIDGGRLVSDGEEGISNMGSPGVSAANDIFWEQFLSETPSVADQELERELDLGADSKEVDEDETVDSSVEILGVETLGDEDGGEGKDRWPKKPSVDQLSVRMGQLAPG